MFEQFCFSTGIEKGLLHIKTASFNGSVLTVPVVVVGEQLFQLHLTLESGTDPAEFILTYGEELFYTSTKGAGVSSEGVFSNFKLTVEDQRYRVDLLLVDEDLYIFPLFDAGLYQVLKQDRALIFNYKKFDELG